MFGTLLCMFREHRRQGRSIRWDGMDYRAVCRHCGTTLYKKGNVRWRPVPRRRDTLLLTYQADDVTFWPGDAPLMLSHMPDGAGSPALS